MKMTSGASATTGVSRIQQDSEGKSKSRKRRNTDRSSPTAEVILRRENDRQSLGHNDTQRERAKSRNGNMYRQISRNRGGRSL